MARTRHGEQQDQFVLRSVEAAHACPVLGPDAQVDQLSEHGLRCLLQQAQTSPVYEEIDERPRSKDRGHCPAELAEEVQQRVTVHRSEEHTSELQSLMRISYAVFCLKKKK